MIKRTLARFTNTLHQYTADNKHKELTKHAIRYLSSTDLTEQRRLLAGILLANRELNKK